MNTIDQLKLIRLQYERQNLYAALRDFSISYDSCSEKRTRREIAKQLMIVNSRLTEFDRIINILHINLER